VCKNKGRKFPKRLEDFVAVITYANVTNFLEEPTTLAKACILSFDG
jgi:hypothetical protein